MQEYQLSPNILCAFPMSYEGLDYHSYIWPNTFNSIFSPSLVISLMLSKFCLCDVVCNLIQAPYQNHVNTNSTHWKTKQPQGYGSQQLAFKDLSVALFPSKSLVRSMGLCAPM